MPYIVNTTNGNIAAVVNDGVVDTTSTSISLIGKNSEQYGELINENFVRLMEHFANDSSPISSITGQLWYNTDTNKLLAFDGISYTHLNAINSNPTEPIRKIETDLWYDTTNQQLKIFLNSSWQVIYPNFTSTQGKTGIYAETINDNLGFPHVVSSIYVGTARIAIFSNDSFTPTPSIDGFPSLDIGLNLATNYTYFGTAAAADDANTLGGLTSAQFVRSDVDAEVNANLTVQDNLTVGLTVDADSVLAFTADIDDVIVQNILITPVISSGTTSTAGTIEGQWALTFGSSLMASYADLAEKYVSDVYMVPGHVAIFGGEHEITLTEVYADQRAAGVVSTAPAYLMNKDVEGYAIALQGKVPCLVKGPVKKGDLLCTSTSRGAAEKLDNERWQPGVTIGKSLEDHSGEDIKLIQVAVGRF